MLCPRVAVTRTPLRVVCVLSSTCLDSSDDSGNDSLGIDDPDLLDIPPPMTYEAWSVDEMECDAA